MTDNIRNKTIHALKWVSLMQAVNTIGQMLIRIVLASMLFPEDIGLVAIITVIAEVMVTAADMGFNAAVIQKKKIDDSHVNTAFFLNLALGLLLTAGVFFSAEIVGQFYEDLRLIPLLELLSVIIIIRAFTSVQVALCDRDLDFKKVTIITLISLLFSSIVKIVLALKDFGASSIVIGEVVHYALMALLFWLSTPWLPSLKKVNKIAFKELFSFGNYIMLTNVIGLFSRKMDVMFVGKLISTAGAGIYSLGFIVATMLSSLMNVVIQRVIFPSFSRIQDDNEKIKSGYLKIVRLITIIGVPVCVGIIMVAPEFIRIFLKDEWIPSIVIIQWLGLFAISNSIGGILWSQVLKAKGMPGFVLMLTVVRLVALAGFIFVGSNYGLEGIAISVVIYGWVFRFVYQEIVNRIIGISMFDYLKSLIPGLLSSAIMAGGMLATRLICEEFCVNELFLFFALILFGVLIFFTSFIFLFRKDFRELISLTKKSNA